MRHWNRSISRSASDARTTVAGMSTRKSPQDRRLRSALITAVPDTADAATAGWLSRTRLTSATSRCLSVPAVDGPVFSLIRKEKDPGDPHGRGSFRRRDDWRAFPGARATRRRGSSRSKKRPWSSRCSTSMLVGEMTRVSPAIRSRSPVSARATSPASSTRSACIHTVASIQVSEPKRRRSWFCVSTVGSERSNQMSMALLTMGGSRTCTASARINATSIASDRPRQPVTAALRIALPHACLLPRRYRLTSR